ncbi:MAG: hypothetical protein KGJ43_03040, partial [Acidobacteriota bacterium]|nr:hypothetical protein [Acidobacteriota bacterium]
SRRTAQLCAFWQLSAHVIPRLPTSRERTIAAMRQMTLVAPPRRGRIRSALAAVVLGAGTLTLLAAQLAPVAASGAPHGGALSRGSRAVAAHGRARCPGVPAPDCHLLLILVPHGRTHPRAVPVAGPGTWTMPATPSPATPSPGPRAGVPGASTARAAGVPATLLALSRRGAISAADARHYGAIYAAATRSLARLGGTRHSELASVLANVQLLAAGGELNASRLPAVFTTLARNTQWWTTGPLLADGAHIGFPGSRLVWEYYPGQGIEIQWLATFGEANGYYLSGHGDTALRQVLEEARALASDRAGGIAWEYLFHFDGGAPPWTSGLSQGTAVQALARGYERLHEVSFRESAEGALAIFQTPPPAGVRVGMSGGDWYVQYTYDPRDLILNGFIQALVGLYDFTAITGSPTGQRLFEAGDAVARSEVSRYDTGAWSHYDQFTESTLSYHELLAEFLSHLCERTQRGEPLAAYEAARARAGSGEGTGGARTAGRQGGTLTGAGAVAVPSATGGSGGAPPGGSPAEVAGKSAATPIAADQIYCATAKHFTADLHNPPRIGLITRRLPTGARGGVQIALSKVSTVTLTVRTGSRVVWTNTATVEAPRPRLLWVTPARAGSYSVSLTAVDLAGNRASATSSITLVAPPRSGHGRRG